MSRARSLLLVFAALLGGDRVRTRVAPVEDEFYQSEVQTSVDGTGDGRYRFTSGWHLQHLRLWTTTFAELAGRPDLRYLEVGVFEGRSLLWMFENVLTHPSSTATAIDLFDGDYADTFDENLAAAGLGDRVTKLAGPSAVQLRTLSGPTFHIIYIDGSHTADDVYLDAALAWDLLHVGGLMVFDDYAWTGRRGAGPLPEELRPQLAIDAFVRANWYALELVHRDYQLIVRKRENPCVPKDYCTPVGEHNYFWRPRELWTRTGERIDLSAEQRDVVERIAAGITPRDLGEDPIALLREDPRVVRTIAELGLRL